MPIALGKRFQNRLIARGLLGVVFVLLSTVWALVFFVLAGEKKRLLVESSLEIGQLTSAVAGHAKGVLNAVETDLHVVDHWLQNNPTANPRTDPTFTQLVDQLRKDSDGRINIVLLSDAGHLYTIPTRALAPPLDIHDRRYFTVHLEPGPRKLHVGTPVLGRGNGKWILPVSWRLERPVSDIVVVSAALELDRVFVAFEDLRAERTVTLVRHDGIVLSRVPFDPKLIGERWSGDDWSDEFATRERGSFLVDRATGPGRIVAHEKLESYPVSVIVTSGLAEVLAPYRRTRGMLLSATTVFSLVAIAMTFILHRALGARQAAEDQLERLAMQDSLTGFLNRRAFLAAAEAEFARSKRYARPMAVLALDIDHFKRINDTQGHASGDEALRQFALTLTTALRGQDLIGRMGGEEFLAILPETSVPDAAKVAWRIREQVAALRLTAGLETFSVTVSTGVAGLAETDEHLQQVLERADRALYAAKDRGRDTVEMLDAPSSGVDSSTSDPH